jgi:hypothetical protein
MIRAISFATLGFSAIQTIMFLEFSCKGNEKKIFFALFSPNNLDTTEKFLTFVNEKKLAP